MNANNVNKMPEGTSKKDGITTVLKILSVVYLVMNIARLGRELARDPNEKKYQRRL